MKTAGGRGKSTGKKRAADRISQVSRALRIGGRRSAARGTLTRQTQLRPRHRRRLWVAELSVAELFDPPLRVDQAGQSDGADGRARSRCS
jgi:hypothetical protein